MYNITEPFIALLILLVFLAFCGMIGAAAGKYIEEVEARKVARCEVLWDLATTPTDSITVLIECGTS